MVKTIYEINLTNFSKYNSSLKKGHKATLISNNFCDDAKLRVLPLSVRWMFLNIILTCGDHTSDTIELSERQLRDMLESSWSIERALDSLKHLQLLSYSKNDSLLNRIEKNRKEKKRKEVTEGSKTPSVPEIVVDKKISKELNRKIWESYRVSYSKRYQVDPVRNAKVNGLISQLGKRLGESAVEVVEFYLTHNETFYLKKTHSLEYCVKDAESLYLQWQKGKALTSRDVKAFEEKTVMQDTWAAIERGEV